MKKLLKGIYNLIPVKKQIFTVLKKVWKPKEPIWRHLHFKGLIDVKLPNSKEFKAYAHNSQFENELFWEGVKSCWEQTSIPIWIKLCKMSNVVFDVGAQSGLFTLITKAENPNSTIHTFEPSEYFYDLVNKNVSINGFEDIHVNKLGVSNVTGHEHIERVWRSNKYVPTISLDDYIDKFGVERMDLLKVDVDFHEIKVAEGFEKYFSKFQPTVLIEVLTDEIAQGIEKYWKTQELGYLVFSIHEKAGTIRQLPDMSKRGDNMNFLLCKKEVADFLKLDYNP